MENEIVAKSTDFSLSLKYSNVNPTPVKYENEKFLTIIIGAPIIDDKIDYNKTFSLIKSACGELKPTCGVKKYQWRIYNYSF